MTPPTSEHSILLVDDDPDIVLGLQDFLDHHGYKVNVASTCAEALTAAKIHHHDAVILDLSLPDGDGSGVLRALQELDPRLPVIILTAFTTTERTVGSLSEGAFAYLTKPYNREELRAILLRAVGVHELATKVQDAEHALSESEERFRSLVASATDAIVLADQQGAIISWNQSAHRLFGYTQDEVQGRPLTMIMPERYRAAHERGFQRFRTTGQSRMIGNLIAVEGLRKDGTEFPLELSLATWRTGGRSFYSGIIRDITERRRAEEALDRLRRQHALILTQAGEGIYGLDADGNTTFVNAAASTLLGYDGDELLGRSMHQALHHTRPDGTPYPSEACPIYAAIRDGRVHRVTDEVFWRKDGTSFPVEYVSTPIREDLRVVGAVVVFRDITDRKRAEAVIEDTEQRFRSLVANIPGAVYRCACDADWTMHFLSNAILDICGYPASDFIDNLVRSYASVIHPDDRLGVQGQVAKAVLAKHPYEMEYRVLTAGGGSRWVYENGQGIFDQSGRLLWLDGIIFDITGRKSAETALQESEARYRALFDDNPSMYFMVDAQGTVLSVNRFGAARLGYSPDELVGQGLSRVFHESDRKAVRSNLDACLAAPGVAMSWEFRKVRKDGSVIWARESAQAVLDANQVPVVLIVCEDITAIKDAERAVRQSEDFTNQILQSSADCIKVLDLEGRLLFINEAGATLLEIADRSVVMNKPWTEFWEGDDWAAASAALAAAKAGEIGKFVGCCPTVTGRAKWWDVQVTPMYDAHPTLHRLLVTSRDITEYRRVQEALRLSEERLEHVIRGSSDGFWDGHIVPGQPGHSPNTPVWYSPRFKELLGFTDDEFPDVLDSWASRLHPEDKSRVFAALVAHIEGPAPSYDVEYQLLTKQGDYRWFRARAQVVQRDEQGRAVRLAGSLQCIEDRKRAEEALHRNEELLRSVINNSTAVVYAKDVDGRYLLINSRFEQLFSVTLDHVRGKTDHEIFPKEFADAFRANDVRVLTTGQVFELEEFAPHPDGVHTYISSKVPLFDHLGRVFASCGISTDITERKRAEEQLRTSEERLRMALSASHVGIWDWDIRSGRMYWSAGVEALCGLATGSFTGTYAAYLELVYLEDRGSLLALIQQALAGHAAIEATHRVVWPDGSLHWLAWAGRIHRDVESRPLRVLGTVSDVTGRRLHNL